MGKVKGIAILGAAEVIRMYRGLGRKLTPRALHKPYLDERILLTAWYPEEDNLALTAVLTKLFKESATPDHLRPAPGLDVWEHVGRLGSQRYFSSFPELEGSHQGTYRALVSGSDPERNLHERFRSFWRFRHDTGDVETTKEGPNHARVALSNFALVSAEYCRAITGTIWGFMHYSGAEGLVVRKLQCCANGHGRCVWDVTWSGSKEDDHLPGEGALNATPQQMDSQAH